MLRVRPNLVLLAALPFAVALVALASGVARADVLVQRPSPSIACGASITTGVWYQSYSGGPRTATIDIFDAAGQRRFHRVVQATDEWRYFHYRAPCGSRYRVRYTTSKGPPTFTVRVRARRSAALTRAQAQSAARRAASRQVEKYGITYPPSDWSATCSRAGAAWACRVTTTGGQCSGRLTIYGTARHPKARDVRIGCGE